MQQSDASMTASLKCKTILVILCGQKFAGHGCQKCKCAGDLNYSAAAQNNSIVELNLVENWQNAKRSRLESYPDGE